MDAPVSLPPGGRSVLRGPDALARAIAVTESDVERRWLLRQPRVVRRSFVTEVIDVGGGPVQQQRWMLLQDEGVRRSYVAEVLDAPKKKKKEIKEKRVCLDVGEAPRRLDSEPAVAAPSTTGPPDFIGVGTQRSGTTWWFETLLAHPQIKPPRRRRKEQHFFDRFCAEELTDADIAEYHARFPRRPGELAGEWTPRYMHDFWTPRLIARAAPDAKLLIMFRDPIERFRSGVPHRLSRMPTGRARGGHRRRDRTRPLRDPAAPAARLPRRVEAADPPVREVRRRPGGPVSPHAELPRRRPRPPARGFEQQRGTTQAAQKKPLPAHSSKACWRRWSRRSRGSPR